MQGYLFGHEDITFPVTLLKQTSNQELMSQDSIKLDTISCDSQDRYDSSKFVHESDIKISTELQGLLDQATKTFQENQNKKTWYGRCIFLSWYCSLGDCTFCFRSTQKHKISHPKNSRRSMGSVLLEALFCRVFNWRIEFLTGGYGMMPDEELIEFAKTVSEVYGEKIWLNIGVIPKARRDKLALYVKGICASMETLHPELHKIVCPSKPIKPYDEMFTEITQNNEPFKKSIAVIVGMGGDISTDEEISHLYNFIEKHKLDRITLYALKPIKGGMFQVAPKPELYIEWIARIRNKFPKLEIIAGTNLRRSEEVKYLIQAGANAITKFPATKQFGTKKAKLLTKQVQDENREFISNILSVEGIDFEAEIQSLKIKDEYKEQMMAKLEDYLRAFRNPKDQDPKYQKN